MNKCEISVIVPVYNVEDYLDECLQSIVNQTFSDMEILIILSGKSTDCSSAKCVEWEKKDIRIKVFEEKEKGLALARNRGVYLAQGKYIVFIDSDDTVKEDYIEKLHNAIIENDADMAECDYMQVDMKSGEKTYIACTQILGRDLSPEIKMKFRIETVMWRIMTKRELWVNNHILQPQLVAEDVGTYPLLLVYADKIAHVSEALYIYRKGRMGSLMQTQGKSSYEKTLEYLLDEFKKRNIFDEYKDILNEYVLARIMGSISALLVKLPKDIYESCRDRYFEFYNTYFEEIEIKRGALLGGYNLIRIVNKSGIWEEPCLRASFSSMISIVSNKDSKYEIKHDNRYRSFMVNREFNNNYFKELEQNIPDYFFFDLIEERHDIVRKGSGYYTKSDAFEQADISWDGDFEIIKRDSAQCEELWINSCNEFMFELFQHIKAEKVFLVENYLSEYYGDGENMYEYDNIDAIKNINKLLEKYYSYIETEFPMIQVIRAYQVAEYYTDVHYLYGCYPWHLNEWANNRIAEQIKEKTKNMLW